MSSISVFSCEVRYIVDSGCIIIPTIMVMIGRQLGYISNECHVLSWIPKPSIQMTGVDVEESYRVCAIAAKSNESITKGWVI